MIFCIDDLQMTVKILNGSDFKISKVKILYLHEGE